MTNMSLATQQSSQPVTKEYTGGCHCKKFRYRFTWDEAPFDEGKHDVSSCNCSVCRMKGLLFV